MQIYDVIIIGSGPAGLSASIYTGRAQLKTLILEGNILGGNTALTDQIDNYPGFPFGINGDELIDNMWRQAERFGAELKYEMVERLENLDEQLKTVVTTQASYQARTIIIAVGVKRRELGIANEPDYIGRGLSYCATCDGAFFKGATVAVVGGGESAVKEALYLASIASKVYLIHWLDEFQANPSALDKMTEEPKIVPLTNKTIKSAHGEGILNKLVIEDTISKQQQELEVEGLFVSIGMVAAADFLEGILELEDGYIVTNNDLETAKPGIFAAGDIRIKKARQVATAVGDGAIAGIMVTEYLK